MVQKFILLIVSLVFVFPHSLSAASYQWTWYTVDLWSEKWQYTASTLDSGYDSFSHGDRMVQIFSPDNDLFTVMTWWDKKKIASIFSAYKLAIGSKDMKKEQSRATKTGKIHFASLSFISDEGGKNYGVFCILSDTRSKSSMMMNILNFSTPVSQTEAIKICSSVRPTSTMITGTVAQ